MNEPRKLADKVSDETMNVMGALWGDLEQWKEQMRLAGYREMEDGSWYKCLEQSPKFVPDSQGGHIEFAGKIWRPTDER